MKQNQPISMLDGPLVPALIRFALPIALGDMLQQLFNTADTLVVGRFTGPGALAAVGTDGEIVAFLVALSVGLSVGANVLAASLLGAGRKGELPGVCRTALLAGSACGILLALLGAAFAKPLLTLIDTPADIMDDAVLYLLIYLAGYPFLMVYNFGAALLRAEGDSARPFHILLGTGCLNIALNLVFVVGLGWGVAGVATATDIAALTSASLVLRLLRSRLTGRGTVPTGAAALRILAIGIPAGLQGAVFCLANIFVQASVNTFGSAAVAGSTISMNFEYFAYYLTTASGQAVTTFTSQNHAAGQDRRCLSILRRGLILSILGSALICVPVVLFRESIAGLFTTDADVIGEASLRILMILTLQPFCGLFEVPAGFLRGLGRSSLPAAETILGVCLFRIVWVLTVFRATHSLESLFTVFPLSWGVTAVLLLATTAVIWRRMAGHSMAGLHAQRG